MKPLKYEESMFEWTNLNVSEEFISLENNKAEAIIFWMLQVRNQLEILS